MGGGGKGRDKKYLRRLQTVAFLLWRLINSFCDGFAWHKKRGKNGIFSDDVDCRRKKPFLATVFAVAKSIISDGPKRRQKNSIKLIPYWQQFKPSQKIYLWQLKPSQKIGTIMYMRQVNPSLIKYKEMRITLATVYYCRNKIIFYKIIFY